MASWSRGVRAADDEPSVPPGRSTFQTAVDEAREWQRMVTCTGLTVRRSGECATAIRCGTTRVERPRLALRGQDNDHEMRYVKEEAGSMRIDVSMHSPLGEASISLELPVGRVEAESACSHLPTFQSVAPPADEFAAEKHAPGADAGDQGEGEPPDAGAVRGSPPCADSYPNTDAAALSDWQPTDT